MVPASFESANHPEFIAHFPITDHQRSVDVLCIFIDFEILFRIFHTLSVIALTFIVGNDSFSHIQVVFSEFFSYVRAPFAIDLLFQEVPIIKGLGVQEVSERFLRIILSPGTSQFFCEMLNIQPSPIAQSYPVGITNTGNVL